jgi:hypothetical protein
MWLLTLQLFKNSIATQGKLMQIEPPLIECEWAFRIQAEAYKHYAEHKSVKTQLNWIELPGAKYIVLYKQQ